MASTVFRINLGVIVFTLTFAIGTFPASANQEPCGGGTTCRPGEEKLIAQTTPSPYDESKKAAYSKYEVEDRNHTAINRLNDEMETVTSESTSTATYFSNEDTLGSVVTLVEQHQPEDVTEVHRLLNEQPAETSTPAAADTQHTTAATSKPQSSQGQTPVATVPVSQPTTVVPSLSQSSQAQTPVAAASPSPPTSPPDYDAVCPLWSLPSADKGRRLIEAAEEGRAEDVEALLAAGADVGARDYLRLTALHRAAARGHLEVARRLLEVGAEVDAREWYQRTPLHWTALRGHVAVVRLLLAASANPNARSDGGWTPLHMAAENGQVEAAAALLQAGTDRGAKYNAGKTPLDFAREFNHQAVIQLLTHSY